MNRVWRDAIASLGVAAFIIALGIALLALFASNVRLSASAGIPTPAVGLVSVQLPPTLTPSPTPVPTATPVPPTPAPMEEPLGMPPLDPLLEPMEEAATTAQPQEMPQPISPSPTPALVLPPEGVEPRPVAQPPSTRRSGSVACGRRIVHVVQPGENLFRIALRYNTTILSIARLNGILDTRLIRAGQRLTVITCAR